MRKKLGHWLNGATLHAMGDRYHGIIASIVDQPIRNKFTTQTTMQTVVVFTDGKQIVLNRSMQYELIDRLGYETDHWVGHTLVVACRRVERIDAKTGQTIVIFEKYLPPSTNNRQMDEPLPAWVTDTLEPDVDPIGANDDVGVEGEDHAPRFARQRR